MSPRPTSPRLRTLGAFASVIYACKRAVGSQTRKGVVVAVLVAATVTGCSTTADENEFAADPERALHVYAAASLDEPFAEIGRRFMVEHPDVVVSFNLAGSSDLVTQISEGAPADVLATANESTMANAVDFVGEATLFATNTLVIAVHPGNPKGIAGLEDLTSDDVITVICAPQVPCGSATKKVLDAAGITLNPASEEPSVTGVLSKVESKEADAGLVYTTDIARADVEAVTFPEAEGAVNRYPIAVVNESANTELAQEFVDFVLGDEGQAVLAEAGFEQP